jgi:hypothetical protein
LPAFADMKGSAPETKPAPPGRGRGRKAKGDGPGPHIAVSEPWPLGVVIASQLPLATYFQWAVS